MDMTRNNESNTQWILNLTEEEAKNFEYISKTTGYTVNGIMLNSLLSIYNNPLGFMRDCDISVLEPYRFNSFEPISGEFDEDGHFSLFGPRLTGCRAAVDKVLGIIIEWIYRNPLTTTSIIWTVPEVEAMCEHKGGKWSEATVGNEVRDMLKTVAQRTDWIEFKLNKKHEYVFYATPKLREYMATHKEFKRSNIETIAIKNIDKTYEALITKTEEPAEPDIESDIDDDDNGWYTQEIIRYLREYAGVAQEISDKYPLTCPIVDVYAKTAFDVALRILCEKEGSIDRNEFVRSIKKEIEGDILIDKPADYPKNLEENTRDLAIYRRVAEQVSLCMRKAGVVTEDESDNVWLMLPDEESRAEHIKELWDCEEEIKEDNDVMNQMNESGFNQLGAPVRVRLV